MVRESPSVVGSFTLAGLPRVRRQWVAAGIRILEVCGRDTLKPGGTGTGWAGASQVLPAKLGWEDSETRELSMVKAKEFNDQSLL